MGHRPGVKVVTWYRQFDGAQDMRGEYLRALKDMGVEMKKHHHEVALVNMSLECI